MEVHKFQVNLEWRWTEKEKISSPIFDQELKSQFLQDSRRSEYQTT